MSLTAKHDYMTWTMVFMVPVIVGLWGMEVVAIVVALAKWAVYLWRVL